MSYILNPNFFGKLAPGSRYFKVSAGMMASIIDGNGNETITVAQGGKLQLDYLQGVNSIVFEGVKSTEVQFYTTTKQQVFVRLKATQETIASLFAVSNAQTLHFTDTNKVLALSSNIPQVDGIAVTTGQIENNLNIEIQSTVTATNTTTVTPTAWATHILNPNFWGTLTPQTPNWMVSSGMVAKINDAIGNQTITVALGGKLDLDGALGSNVVIFEGLAAADIQVYRSGQEARVQLVSTGETIASIPVIAAPQTLRFSNGVDKILLLSGIPRFDGNPIASDNTAPTLLSATVAEATLVLTYSEELDAIHVPDTTSLTIQVGSIILGSSDYKINNPHGKEISITLSKSTLPGAIVNVTYNDPTANNDIKTIQDINGNDAPTVVAFPVLNLIPDVTAPVFISEAFAYAVDKQNVVYNTTVNEPSGPVVYTLSGTDAGLLQVDGTGKVTLKTGTLSYTSDKLNYSFQVTATDAYHNSATQSVKVFLNHAPTGTASVTVVGNKALQQNETLQVTVAGLSDADGVGDLAYQWFANGTAIDSDGTNKLLLSENEVGKNITAWVSYFDGVGNLETLKSTATLSIANTNDPYTGDIWIDGDFIQGGLLRAFHNLEDPDGVLNLTWTWYVNGSTTPLSTGSTYELTEAQVGKAIVVKATYADKYGTNTTVASSTSPVIDNINDPITGNLAISGNPQQGSPLTVFKDFNDADGTDTISYAWFSDGNLINSASGTVFTPTQEQVGTQISVIASYVDKHGTPEAIESLPTTAIKNINDAPGGTVTINGKTEQNTLLKAGNTLSDPDGLGDFNYQWFANNTKITGATDDTFILTEDEVGKIITVTISYVDGFGYSEIKTSATSTTVTNINDPYTGSVWVEGEFVQGAKLTAMDDLEDPDGISNLNYTWYLGGSNQMLATGKTFVLPEAEVGKTVYVKAQYSDRYTPATNTMVSSPATGIIDNVNDDVMGTLSISGQPQQGQVLTAIKGFTDADGIDTINYAWFADGNLVASGASQTFTPTQNEVGAHIAVIASYTDRHGTAETIESAPTAVVQNTNDLPTGSVKVNGTVEQNSTLQVIHDLADPDGLGDLSYEWFANNSPIPGATEEKLTLSEAEVGQVIKVVVSYVDNFGASESKSYTTAVVKNVNDPHTGNVWIEGDTIQGAILVVSNDLADLDGFVPEALTYAWFADNQIIPSATGTELLLTTNEVGHQISVQASYTDGHGTSEVATAILVGIITTA